MTKEDLVTLERVEQERKRVEQLANESEKYVGTVDIAVLVGCWCFYQSCVDANMNHWLNSLVRHLINFRHLMMEDPEGLAAFLAFARQEFAEDLVTFWISIEEFKEVCSCSPLELAQTIHSRCCLTSTHVGGYRQQDIAVSSCKHLSHLHQVASHQSYHSGAKQEDQEGDHDPRQETFAYNL